MYVQCLFMQLYKLFTLLDDIQSREQISWIKSMVVCAFQNSSVTSITVAAKLILDLCEPPYVGLDTCQSRQKKTKRNNHGRNLAAFATNSLLAHNTPKLMCDVLFVGWSWKAYKNKHLTPYQHFKPAEISYNLFLWVFCSISCLICLVLSPRPTLTDNAFFLWKGLCVKPVYEKDFINKSPWHQYLLNNLVTHLNLAGGPAQDAAPVFWGMPEQKKFRLDVEVVLTLTAAAIRSDRLHCRSSENSLASFGTLFHPSFITNHHERACNTYLLFPIITMLSALVLQIQPSHKSPQSAPCFRKSTVILSITCKNLLLRQTLISVLNKAWLQTWDRKVWGQAVLGMIWAWFSVYCSIPLSANHHKSARHKAEWTDEWIDEGSTGCRREGWN